MFSSHKKCERKPELTHGTSVRSQSNYNFSGGETEVEKHRMRGRETDGQAGQRTISFPQGTSYKFIITCNFPIHWGRQGSRNRADGSWPAATL